MNGWMGGWIEFAFSLIRVGYIHTLVAGVFCSLA